MTTNNNINQVIFKQIASNTSSITITPPSTTNTILINLRTVKSTNTASSFLLAQTAPSSGVFDTTGYQSGSTYEMYNSNALGSQSSTNGFRFTAGYESTGEYFSGNIWVTDLNSENPVSCTGQLANFNIGDRTTYFIYIVGTSQTTQATQIRLQMSAGLIASGIITAYSLY